MIYIIHFVNKGMFWENIIFIDYIYWAITLSL